MGAGARFGRQGSCGKCHAAWLSMAISLLHPIPGLTRPFFLVSSPSSLPIPRARLLSRFASSTSALCFFAAERAALREGCLSDTWPRLFASLLYISIYTFFFPLRARIPALYLGRRRLCAVPFHSPFSRRTKAFISAVTTSSATHLASALLSNSAFWFLQLNVDRLVTASFFQLACFFSHSLSLSHFSLFVSLVLPETNFACVQDTATKQDWTPPFSEHTCDDRKLSQTRRESQPTARSHKLCAPRTYLLSCSQRT